MKKGMIIAATGIMIIVFSACGASAQDTMTETEETETSTVSEETSCDAAAIQEAEEKQTSEESEETAKKLYETFLNQEYAGLENYAYSIYDADNDGKEELLIMYKGQKKNSGYIIKYMNGGLHLEYQKEFASEMTDGFTWTETEDISAQQNEEMVHYGIYVYADQEHTRYWYQNEEDFIKSAGFGETEPFFEYSDFDGQKRLIFYYDEQTQKGCGIRYYERDPTTFFTTGMYGFLFEGLREGVPKDALDNLERNYFKTESIDGASALNCAEEVEENVEYDEEGRIKHYDAAGILADLDSTEPTFILWIDYEYYENGNLKNRLYWHNGYVFGSWGTTWNSCFDELGRIVYEDTYITHGSLDTYYIYTDDTDQPAYILDIDNNAGTWMPELWKLEETVQSNFRS